NRRIRPATETGGETSSLRGGNGALSPGRRDRARPPHGGGCGRARASTRWMFRRILIANRGEVAARVLRTCRRLGVEAVAVASEADRGSAWLAEAARVAEIGGPRPAQSYLDQDALIEVALHHRCAAVHPGWGFLSENAEFAAKVTAAGLTFIGPPPRHL